MAKQRRELSLADRRKAIVEFTGCSSREDTLILINAADVRIKELQIAISQAKLFELELNQNRKMLLSVIEEIKNIKKITNIFFDNQKLFELIKKKDKVESLIQNWQEKKFYFDNREFVGMDKYFEYLEKEMALSLSRKRLLVIYESVWADFEKKLVEYQSQEALRQAKEISRESKQKRVKALADAYSGRVREAATVVRKRLPRNHNCPYCGGGLGKAPHADHIHPVSRGGLSTVENLVFVCNPCNVMKGNLTLNQFISKYGLNITIIHERLRVLGKEF